MTPSVEEAKRVVKEKYPKSKCIKPTWREWYRIVDGREIVGGGADKMEAWLNAALRIQKGIKK